MTLASKVRLALVVAADWLDAHVIGHRSYWLCCRISESKWWDDETCQ